MSITYLSFFVDIQVIIRMVSLKKICHSEFTNIKINRHMRIAPLLGYLYCLRSVQNNFYFHEKVDRSGTVEKQSTIEEHSKNV